MSLFVLQQYASSMPIRSMKKSRRSFARKCPRWTFEEPRSATIENGVGTCGYVPQRQNGKVGGDYQKLTLKIEGYSIPKPSSKDLTKKDSMGSKSKTSQETIWNLIEKIIFGTTRLFCLVHKLGRMKFCNFKNILRNQSSLNGGPMAFLQG